MPFIKSLASKRCTYMVAIILLLNEIMLTYSYYVLKGLVYIAIMAPSGRQPSFYTKYTKLNMRSSCNIRLVFITKCAFLMRSYILQSLRLLCLIYLRVSCNSCYGEARLKLSAALDKLHCTREAK